MIGFAVEIIYRLCLALVLAQRQAKMSEKIVLSYVYIQFPILYLQNIYILHIYQLMQPLPLRCKNNSVLELCRDLGPAAAVYCWWLLANGLTSKKLAARRLILIIESYQKKKKIK